MRNCRDKKKQQLKSIISNIKTHSDFFYRPTVKAFTHQIYSFKRWFWHRYLHSVYEYHQQANKRHFWGLDDWRVFKRLVNQSRWLCRSCVAAGVKTSNPTFWFFIQVLFLCCLLSHVQCVKTFSWQPDSSLLSDFIYCNHTPRRIPGGFGTHLAQEKINYHLQADPALWCKA